MNARILAGTLLLLSATAGAAAQPYADAPGDRLFAGDVGNPGLSVPVRSHAPGAAVDLDAGSGASASLLLRGENAHFTPDEADPRKDGAEAEAVLAGALEKSPSGNLVAVILGPLFPGRTDWSTPLPRDLAVTPFVTSAPGWPGAWSVGVKLPRGH